MPLEISTHTPHTGRNGSPFLSLASSVRFQLTRPTRGATGLRPTGFGDCYISTHTPHTGRNLQISRLRCRNVQISTHTPHTGRNYAPVDTFSNCTIFQLTRPTRGATPFAREKWVQSGISTHTPHTGRNSKIQAFSVETSDFNSHAPHGAQRHAGPRSIKSLGFQLTRPTRGATCPSLCRLQCRFHFNSHAPHGAQRAAFNAAVFSAYFNSHAPHGAQPHTPIIDDELWEISTHTPHTGRNRTALYGAYRWA